MARTQLVRLAILLIGVLFSRPVFAGDAFTGYQVDNKGQYFAFLGVRTPLMEQRNGFQPFLQVFGAGVGYTFKDNGRERDANLLLRTADRHAPGGFLCGGIDHGGTEGCHPAGGRAPGTGAELP